MKKILLINNGYPSRTHPNYVTYVESIKGCLEDAGFKVDLLVLDSNFKSFIGKYFRFLQYYFRLFFFSKYAYYDYVYINNYPYSFFPMILHFQRMKKIIIHWHGDDIFPDSAFSRTLNAFSYRFIRNDVIHIAPSLYFAKEAAQVLGIDETQIRVSPSGGVNTDQFVRRDSAIRRKGIIRLGFASGLLQSKGMDLVIELLRDLSSIEKEIGLKIEFHYIDYGKERNHYGLLLADIDRTIKHAPYPISKMADFYNQIDVLLFPSLRKAESLGLVSLESMSCEAPVIATDNFAFRDTVILGITGERFEMNDSSSFRMAVIKCILNIGAYTPREFVMANFSKKSVAAKYSFWFGKS